MSVIRRTAERYIRELREGGFPIRHGSARGRYWEVRNRMEINRIGFGVYKSNKK